MERPETLYYTHKLETPGDLNREFLTVQDRYSPAI